MSDDGLLAYIVQLEKMFAKVDAENARLREFNDAIIRYAGMREAAQEIDRLKKWLQVIADHPVEDSGMWEVGAREMLRCARAALAGEEKI